MGSCEVLIQKNEREHEVFVDHGAPTRSKDFLPQTRVEGTPLSEILDAPATDPRHALLGLHLWQALGLSLGALSENDCLVIRSNDPSVLCLPWHQLHDGQGVLVKRGVVVEVGHRNAPRSPYLNAHLRIVLAVPDAHEDHELWRDALSTKSGKADTDIPGFDLLCVGTPSDLCDHLGGADIAVIPALDADSQWTDRHAFPLEIGTVSCSSLAKCAQQYPPRILLIGTPGPPPFWLLQRAAELSEHVPCVIVVPEPGGKPGEAPPPPQQALKLVRALYQRRYSPARACNAPELGWEPGFCPRCFGGDKPPRPETPSTWLRDSNWPLKLDRRTQARLAVGTITEGSATALLWYGPPNSGLERLHGRLRLELRSRRQDVSLLKLRWPYGIEYYEPADFAGMYEHHLKAQRREFEPGSRDTLRHRIERCYPALASGARQVLYIDHQVLPAAFARQRDAANVLCDYLAWFREVIAEAMPERLAPVLGLALMLDMPEDERASWGATLERELGRAKARYRPLQVQRLPELPDVTEEDVLDFLVEYPLDVPEDKREGVVRALLRVTEGRYDPTLREIEQLPFTWHWWWKRR